MEICHPNDGFNSAPSLVEKKMCLLRREIIPELLIHHPEHNERDKPLTRQQDNGVQFGKYCDMSFGAIKEHFHVNSVNAYILFYL